MELEAVKNDQVILPDQTRQDLMNVLRIDGNCFDLSLERSLTSDLLDFFNLLNAQAISQFRSRQQKELHQFQIPVPELIQPRYDERTGELKHFVFNSELARLQYIKSCEDPFMLAELVRAFLRLNRVFLWDSSAILKNRTEKERIVQSAHVATQISQAQEIKKMVASFLCDAHNTVD